MSRTDTPGPILVTGATGFVGEHLVRRLAATHGAVVAVGHRRSVSVPGASMVQRDLKQPEATDALVQDTRPAVVFHCAADTDTAFCQAHGQEAAGNIVRATENLAQAVKKLSPQPVVVALSTDLVFDGEHAPYRETDQPDPISIYGRLKLAAEQPILALSRGAVMRTSLVYGPRSTHKGSFLAWMIETLSRRERLRLFQDEVRTPIRVDDLCGAMVAIAQRDESGLWHVGGSQRLDRVTMGRVVCDVFGLDRTLLEPIKVADSTLAVPRARDVSLDSSRLWSLLGYHPCTFEEGLRAVGRQWPAV